jgi:glycerophosphoryl diester phosphodiesterase
MMRGAVPPITFAHRGARAVLPENTIPAFRHALQAGARGLETDAYTAADGEVVLVHDPVIKVRRVGVVPGRVRVATSRSTQLAQHGVPRLRDLYLELGADYELSIDLKDPEVGERILTVARDLGDPGQLWLCSPSRTRLRGLRASADDVHLVHSTFRRRLPEPLERHAADLAEHAIDAMNLHHSEWTRGLVELFHRFDVRAFAWDVQEVRHLREMLRIGVDAVYSDHVDRMVATVAEWTA